MALANVFTLIYRTMYENYNIISGGINPEAPVPVPAGVAGSGQFNLGQAGLGYANTAGGILNTAFDFWQQERNYKRNKADALEAYNRSIDFWRMQNAYNSPIQQMQRLREAGINPHMAYAKGTLNNVASGSVKGERTDSNTRVNPLQEIAQYQTIRNMRLQNDLLQKNVEYKELRNTKEKIDLGMIVPEQVEDEHGRMTSKNLYYAKLFNAATLSAEKVMTQWEINNLTREKISALELTNRIEAVKADLAEQGINFNDNAIIRAIVTALAKEDISINEVTADIIKSFL